jgi:hypothetical protein
MTHPASPPLGSTTSASTSAEVAVAITRSIHGRSMLRAVSSPSGIKDPAKLAAFVVAIRSTIG